MATIIRKQGNTRKPYTVRYWHEGRQRERSFRIKREAQDFIANFEHSRREGSYVDARDGSITFKDYAERWLSMHTGKPATVAAYRSALNCHIYPAIGDKQMRKITRERLRDLLLVELPSKKISETRTLGHHTIAKCLLVISAVLDEAVRERKITANPAKSIRLPARPPSKQLDIPSPEVIDKLTAGMFRFRAAVPLMVGCGLRIGEALAVKYENVHDGWLRITEQKRPDGTYGPLKHRKAGEYRDVPLPSWVAQELSQGSTGYVFGTDATHDTVSRVFRSARDAAGLPSDFTPHSLRHVFASVALSNGVPLTDVSRFLGHVNIQVTYGLYSHLIPTSVGSATAVLDKWHDA